MCLISKEHRKISKGITCYIIFRNKNILGFYKTVRRSMIYRPKSGKRITKNILSQIVGKNYEITGGIYSYVSIKYWPHKGDDFVIWECKIPKGSLYYSNSWEYVSDEIEFLYPVKNPESLIYG